MIRIQVCPGVSIPCCPGGPKLAGFLREETVYERTKNMLIYKLYSSYTHIRSYQYTNHQICISTHIYIIYIYMYAYISVCPNPDSMAVCVHNSTIPPLLPQAQSPRRSYRCPVRTETPGAWSSYRVSQKLSWRMASNGIQCVYILYSVL